MRRSGVVVLTLAVWVAVLAPPAATRADPLPAEASGGAREPASGGEPDAVAPAASEDASDDDLGEPSAGEPTGRAARDADEADAEGSDAPGDADPTDDADDADSAHDDAGSGRTRRPFRWSDGPRRVPTPHGRSAERAEELGLGTRECASRLLHGEPDASWCAAARGREPERLLWPVDDGGWVRGFGYVRTTRPDLIHRGVDIAAPEGTVVRAAADGIVAYADNGVHGYGNLVLIVHANGWMTLYAHNRRVTVQAGYRVRRGERIALVGSTGIAHGPHVHFELWQDGHAVDPAALFDGGPAFVERIAERAAARGDVPPPGEVTPADRPEEAPLPPHPDDAPSARAAPRDDAARGTSVAPAPTDAAPPDTLALGSVALARHLLSHPAPDAVLDAVEGRVFSTLLFPVRGGETTRPHSSSRRPMEITGDEGTAIRAAADGVVVFSGALPGHGDTVVVLHENGWATFYERITLAAEVAVGSSVERGAWIARASARAMRFELRIGGVVRDPADVLVDPRETASD